MCSEGKGWNRSGAIVGDGEGTEEKRNGIGIDPAWSPSNFSAVVASMKAALFWSIKRSVGATSSEVRLVVERRGERGVARRMLAVGGQTRDVVTKSADSRTQSSNLTRVTSHHSRQWVTFSFAEAAAAPRWGQGGRGGTGPPQIAARPPNLAVLLTRCGQLILRKINKFDAIRCQILRLQCTKFYFRWGSLQCSTDPLAVFKEAYF